jgi:MFS family permease
VSAPSNETESASTSRSISPPARPTARAYTVWAIGMAAYVVAVFHRASLGVTGVEAQHRFAAGASAISLFLVLQLVVYAGLQIPVGVALDRFGSRRMIVAGGLTMAAGQLVLALATDVPTAIAARVLVGAGDAMTFISVLRLVAAWFPPGRVALLTQMTGLLGQSGQIVAAYPLVALLGGAGWGTSFLVASAVGFAVAVLAATMLRNAPPGPHPPVAPIGWGQAVRHLGLAWREPGTRLGLWTHFVTQFSGTVFALLWGYPFLVRGEHLSAATAGSLLSAMVFVGMAVGPVIGRLTARWPLRRSALTLTIVGASASLWTAVLLWPGRAPLWLVVVLVLVLATNGPGSMIGFDYARTFNPARRMGSASGIVNVGGFVASLTVILLVGVVLDLRTSGGPAAYRLGDLKLAFCVQYAFWAFGVVMVLRIRTHLRRRLETEEGVVVHPLHVAIARRWSAVSARR